MCMLKYLNAYYTYALASFPFLLTKRENSIPLSNFTDNIMKFDLMPMYTTGTPCTPYISVYAYCTYQTVEQILH